MFSAKHARPAASHPKKETHTAPGWLREALLAYLLTLGVGLLSILIFSLTVYFTPDPGRLTRPAGLLCIALTSLVGGAFAVRIRGKETLLSALLNASLLSATLLALSLPFHSGATGYSLPLVLLLHLGIFLLSIFGAVVARPRPKAHPKRRKKAKNH